MGPNVVTFEREMGYHGLNLCSRATPRTKLVYDGKFTFFTPLCYLYSEMPDGPYSGLMTLRTLLITCPALCLLRIVGSGRESNTLRDKQIGGRCERDVRDTD